MLRARICVRARINSHAERKRPRIGQPSRYAEGKNMCQGKNKFTRREEEASDGAAEQAF